MSNEMNEMGISFEDLMNAGQGGSKFAPVFEDGLYLATVIGVVRAEHTFEDPTGPAKTKIKDSLIYQVYDSNDVCQVLKGSGYTMSLNDKSATYKLLSGIVKETEPVKIGEKLKAMGIIKEGQFSFCNFIGRSFQLMVQTVPSKNGKMYPRITNVLPAKANQKFELKMDMKVPQFFVEDAITYQLMDGISVFEKKAVGADAEPDLDAFTQALQEDLK